MTNHVEFSAAAEADFAAIAALAREIWHGHFSAMISREQIDYMLAGRYAPENLSRYLDAPDRWFRLLRLDGNLSGYFSCALTGKPGEMKLEQLYLLAALRGQGWGGRMLDEAETAARAEGCGRLMLTVNRHNADAIAVYEKKGFRIREQTVADIGNGFVMDDYVMEKTLA
ncbi:GNAT family N-acetyltransferase [Xenophilus sp. AP218F]|nr:GNAT family N-acetyltransferase [Xenophilus sp. AP218F]